jgi:hypothetical protein
MNIQKQHYYAAHRVRNDMKWTTSVYNIYYKQILALLMSVFLILTCENYYQQHLQIGFPK